MAHVKGTNPAGQVFDWYNFTTNDDDTVIGNAGKDWIYGNGGNDTIKGGGGADYINGGEGRDAVVYVNSNEGVEINLAQGYGNKGGTAEGDIILGVEDVIGSAYDDKIIGNWDDNRLQGGGGNDILKGGGEFDILEGGSGNDILQLDNFHGQAHGGSGIDTLVLNTGMGMRVDLKHSHFERVVDTGLYGAYDNQISAIENVAGSPHDDEITGDDAANLLNGLGGHDALNGGKGNNSLFGDLGNDILCGGYGVDTLTGDAGQDTFVFKAHIDSIMGAASMDIIMDFHKGQDKIDLTAMDPGVGNLLIVNNQNVDGVSCSVVGLDYDHDGTLDMYEFALMVKMAPGATLGAADVLI